MKKALVTGCDENQESILSVTEPLMRAYAEYHGYDFVKASDETRGRKAQWLKVLAIERALRDYDVVLWLDADIVIRNATEDILAGMSLLDHIGIVTHHTNEGDVPNVGVLLLRSSPDTMRLVREWWDGTAHEKSKWNDNANFQELFGYSINPPVRKEHDTIYSKIVWDMPGKWNTLISQSLDGAFLHVAGGRAASKKAEIARKLAKSYIEDV